MHFGYVGLCIGYNMIPLTNSLVLMMDFKVSAVCNVLLIRISDGYESIESHRSEAEHHYN